MMRMKRETKFGSFHKTDSTKESSHAFLRTVRLPKDFFINQELELRRLISSKPPKFSVTVLQVPPSQKKSCSNKWRDRDSIK